MRVIWTTRCCRKWKKGNKFLISPHASREKPYNMCTTRCFGKWKGNMIFISLNIGQSLVWCSAFGYCRIFSYSVWLSDTPLLHLTRMISDTVNIGQERTDIIWFAGCFPKRRKIRSLFPLIQDKNTDYLNHSLCREMAARKKHAYF